MTPADTMRAAVEALENAGLLLEAGCDENAQEQITVAVSLLRSALEQGEPEEHARALHQQIMNLPCKVPDIPGVNSDLAYRVGHRAARHAAAELVLASIPPNTPVEDGKLGTAVGVIASEPPKRPNGVDIALNMMRETKGGQEVKLWTPMCWDFARYVAQLEARASGVIGTQGDKA